MTIQSNILTILLLLILASCSKDSHTETQEVKDSTPPNLSLSIAGADNNTNSPIITVGKLEVQVEASDASGIRKVEAFLNGEKVAEDTTSPYRFEIDLTSLQVNSKNSPESGNILKITATDTSGNQNSIERTIIISARSPLITITIPEGFLNSFFENVHVFASGMDGQLLENTTLPIYPSTRSVTLFAPEGFGPEEEFMVTFMSSIPRPDLKFSFASTFQNLTMDNPREIQLRLPDRLKVIENGKFPASGFAIDSLPQGYGADYSTNLHIEEKEWLMQILETEGNPDKRTDKLFLWSHLGTFTNYYYHSVDRPLPADFELNLEDFENNNSASGAISFTNYAQIPEISTELAILGYESDKDFENDAFHTVWSQRTKNFAFPIRYGYYTEFHKYRYRLTMQQFHIEDEGLPLDEYTLPSWELNPALSGNAVNLNKSGSGHTVGRLILRENAPGYMYDWRIIFNSEKAESVVIPELPEIFQTSTIGQNRAEDNLNIHQLEFRQYGSIPSYEEYLNLVLRTNEDPRDVSEKVEVIFMSDIPVYIQYKDLFFD